MRPLLVSLALLPLACGRTPGFDTDGDTGSSGDPGGSTTAPSPTTSGVPTTSGEPGTSTLDTTGTTTTTTTDPSTGAATTDPLTSSSTASTSTSSTSTTGSTSDSSTSDGSTTDDTGEPPPPPPDEMPDLVCPGDPDGHCEPVEGAPLRAGAAVLPIIPSCFEGWIDNDADAVFDAGDTLLDCGCDRICPGDPDYKLADAGEGDQKLQASWLAGFQNGRAATGIRGADQGLVGEGDGLWSRALVLEQGNTKLAIVALDLVGFFNDETITIRDELAAKGLEVDYVLLHSTHNHEGPDTMGLWGPQQGVSGYDPAYGVQVRAAIVEAIVAADAALEPVKQMTVGEVDVSTYHENGVANLIRDSRDPWVVDEFLGALRLVGEADQTIATLVSFGNHPEAVADENTLITSDFAHAVRRTLEQGSTWKQAPGQPGVGGPCLYINASVGGLMTPLGVTVVTPDGDMLTSASFEKADAIGQLIGEIALDALANGDKIDAPQLDLQAHRFKARIDNTSFNLMFELGIFDREVFQEQDGKYLETEMALVNLGPVQLLSVPGELHPELAVGGYDGSHINAPGVPLIKANNPNPPKIDLAPEGPYLKDKMHGTYRWIVGLGNDELGYILPEYDFVLGDPPWISEADGDHYEETNSLGPQTFAKVDAAADVLTAWSKWVHGLP